MNDSENARGAKSKLLRRDHKGHKASKFSVHDNASFRIGDDSHFTRIDTQINIDSSGNSSGPIIHQIASWLEPIDFKLVFEDLLHPLHQETATSMLDTIELKRWLNESGAWLWCFGMPGAGKTSLATMLVHRLSRSESVTRGASGLAYVYCRHSAKDPAIAILRSMLSQLVYQHTSVSQSLVDLYYTHKAYSEESSIKQVSLQDCEQALKTEMARFETVHVVVDALDECVDNDGGEMLPGTRETLLRTFEGFGDMINLFVTSRAESPDLMDAGRDKESRWRKMEMTTSDKDIASYVRGYIARSKVLRSYTDECLSQEIQQTVAKKAAGMFLPAQLYMEILTSAARSRNKTNVQARLRSLPAFDATEDIWTKYRKAYGEILKDIWNQEDDLVELARGALCCIVFSDNPPNLSVVQRALGVEEGDSSRSDLLLACRGLVIVDDRTQIIRLVHYTAERYFSSSDIRQEVFSREHLRLADTCLSYLTSVDLGQPDESRQEHPFFEHASGQWMHHATRAEAQLRPRIRKFMTASGYLAATFEPVAEPLSTGGEFSSEPTDGTLPLHVTTYSGLRRLAGVLRDADAEGSAVGSLDLVPMPWVFLGASATMIANRCGDSTPPTVAAEHWQNGHRSLLVGHSAYLNGPEDADMSSLLWALQSCRYRMMFQNFKLRNSAPLRIGPWSGLDAKSGGETSNVCADTRWALAVEDHLYQLIEGDLGTHSQEGTSALCLAVARHGEYNLVLRVLIGNSNPFTCKYAAISGTSRLTFGPRTLLEQIKCQDKSSTYVSDHSSVDRCGMSQSSRIFIGTNTNVMHLACWDLSFTCISSSSRLDECIIYDMAKVSFGTETSIKQLICYEESSVHIGNFSLIDECIIYDKAKVSFGTETSIKEMICYGESSVHMGNSSRPDSCIIYDKAKVSFGTDTSIKSLICYGDSFVRMGHSSRIDTYSVQDSAEVLREFGYLGSRDHLEQNSPSDDPSEQVEAQSPLGLASISLTEPPPSEADLIPETSRLPTSQSSTPAPQAWWDPDFLRAKFRREHGIHPGNCDVEPTTGLHYTASGRDTGGLLG